LHPASLKAMLRKLNGRKLMLLGLAWIVMATAAAPSVTDVQGMIARQGAVATVQALSADGRWDAILDRIGAGDTAWIALAPRLAPGADAGTSEGLGIALATALPAQPAAVLAVLTTAGPPSLSPARVCSAPFIEDTAAHQHAYKAQALSALVKVTNAKLQTSLGACRAQLARIK